MTYKIWVKLEDDYPIKIVIDKGDVDDLKKAIKKELSSLNVNRIKLRKHGDEVDLDPELEIDESFVNDSKTPIQIFVKASSNDNDVKKSDWKWPCFKMKQDYWGDKEITPIENVQKQGGAPFKIIYFTHRDVCTILVELISQPLIEILQEILPDDNDNINDDEPKIKAQDLYHVWEDLKIKCDSLESESSIETEEKKNHLSHLIRFLEQEYKETAEKHKKMVANTTVSFDMLWAFYVKDLEVWYKCDMSGQQVSGTISSTRSVVETVNYEKVSAFYVTIKVIDYDGHGFKRCYVTRKIKDFDGEKSFIDLEVVPFKYSKAREYLKDNISDYGKRFFDLVTDRNFMEYTGSLFRWKIVDGCRKVEIIKADGRIMIDLKSFATMNPDYLMRNARPPNPCDIELLGEKGYLREYEYENNYRFAPALVYGFSFTLKEWGQFMVTNFSEIKFNKKAFNRLVIPQDEREILLGLVNQYNSQIISDNEPVNKESLSVRQLDPIANKGKGCIFLCYGPPGTGKTLTAEGVAEFLGRPLWTIGVHELGTDPAKVEQQLVKILNVAFTWKAVLLLDEADIYLEKRNSDNPNRNVMTGIFLRQLEYYQGILFLTTNRVMSFDDAFCSRISMFFHYPELTLEKKHEIWKDFIDHAQLDLNANDFSKYKLNGREIRNVLRTAQTLAEGEKKEINKDHVIKVIRMIQKFQKDMEEIKLYDQDYPEFQEMKKSTDFRKKSKVMKLIKNVFKW